MYSFFYIKYIISDNENIIRNPIIIAPNVLEYPLGVIFPILSNFFIIGCNFQKYVAIDKIITTTTHIQVNSVSIINTTIVRI